MSEFSLTPCPFHADCQVSGHCKRCGSFVCPQCQQLNADFCPNCMERAAGFPFNRENLSPFNLLFFAWNHAFKPFWLELSAAVVLCAALLIGLSFIAELPLLALKGTVSATDAATDTAAAVPPSVAMAFALLTFMVFVVAISSLTRGLLEMANTAWSGQKPRFGALFNLKAGLKAACASFLVLIPSFVISAVGVFFTAAVTQTTLLSAGFQNMGLWQALLGMGFAVLIPLLLNLALALWLLPLSMSLLPFAEQPDIGIMEGLRLCWQRGRGQRLLMFGMWLLHACVCLGGVLACCVGVIPAMALSFTFCMGFWKALK